MNNPDNTAIDIDEQREWINAEKARRGLSWSALADLAGLPAGTLSTFATGSYQGRQDRVARDIFKYRQLIESQAERAVGLIERPDYFETETSRRLHGLMVIAHSGRITLGATGPGTGKTITVENYAASVSNVWVATMEPSTKTLTAMILSVLRAIGARATGGSKDQLSQQVIDLTRFKHGLLIVDEANNLSLEQLEQIRAWHDRTGVGICFFGNEELDQRIQSGAHRHAFGRLNSRIASRHIQNVPTQADVEVFCDAYRLDDSASRQLLRNIALTPGAGGLRECRQIVEQASLLASDDNRPLSFGDLRDAQSTRATRNVRA